MLFALTFVSTAFTGTLFVGHTAQLPDPFTLSGMDGWMAFAGLMFWEGVLFAGLLLGFLAIHEFGHFFAARRHRVDTTLPYFIPMPISPIGTLGAIIRINSPIRYSGQLFDVGASGPVAGFIAALFILLIGFTTLPGPEYMANFADHEAINEYIAEHGTFPDEPVNDQTGTEVLMLGNTLLFTFLASFFDNVPPMWELYHYPFLFAGWLALFFTALNLLPVGQLDGGHILYALIGYRRHRLVARLFFVAVVSLAGLGTIPLFELLLERYPLHEAFLARGLWFLLAGLLMKRAFHADLLWTAGGLLTVMVVNLTGLWIVDYELFSGYTIWLFWTLFIVFMVGIEHPPVLVEEELPVWKKVLGWLCLITFLLCISPNPIYFLIL